MIRGILFIVSRLFLLLVLLEVAFQLRVRYVTPFFRDLGVDGEYRVLVIGDSVSMRVDNGEEGYPERLQKLLEENDPARRYKIINLSQTAMRSSQALALLDKELRENRRPSAVVMMMGKSDFLRGDKKPEAAVAPPWYTSLRLYRFVPIFRARLNAFEERVRIAFRKKEEEKPKLSPQEELAEIFKAAEKRAERDDRRRASRDYGRVLKLWREMGEPRESFYEAIVAQAGLGAMAHGREEACRELEQAREMRKREEFRALKEQAEVVLRLGNAAVTCGDYKLAEQLYLESDRITPGRIQLVREMAWLQYRKKDWAKAIVWFVRLTDLEPNNRRSIGALVQAYGSIGKRAEGVKALTRLRKRSEEKALITAHISSLNLASGKKAEAEANLREMMQVAPESRESWKARLYFHRHTGQLEEFDRVFRELTLEIDGGLIPSAIHAYREIGERLYLERIPFVAVQYPSNMIEALEETFKPLPKGSVHLVDARAAVMAAAERDKRHLTDYFQDDLEHITALAAQVIAEKLAPVIRSL